MWIDICLLEDISHIKFNHSYMYMKVCMEKIPPCVYPLFIETKLYFRLIKKHLFYFNIKVVQKLCFTT